MMRQHENVGGESRGIAQKVALGTAHVSEQQHAPAPHLDTQGQGTLVARAPPIARRRPERLDAQIADPRRRAPPTPLDDGNARCSGCLAHLPEAGLPRGSSGNPHGADVHRGEDGGNTTPVVDVRVGRHDEIEAREAEGAQRRHDDARPPIEAAFDRRPGVDEHGSVATLDEDRVPASHVQHDQARRRRGVPGRRHQPEERRARRRPERRVERVARAQGAHRQQPCERNRHRGRREVEALGRHFAEKSAGLQSGSRETLRKGEKGLADP
jgi:hypothetical protein